MFLFFILDLGVKILNLKQFKGFQETINNIF